MERGNRRGTGGTANERIEGGGTPVNPHPTFADEGRHTGPPCGPMAPSAAETTTIISSSSRGCPITTTCPQHHWAPQRPPLIAHCAQRDTPPATLNPNPSTHHFPHPVDRGPKTPRHDDDGNDTPRISLARSQPLGAVLFGGKSHKPGWVVHGKSSRRFGRPDSTGTAGADNDIHHREGVSE